MGFFKGGGVGYQCTTADFQLVVAKIIIYIFKTFKRERQQSFSDIIDSSCSQKSIHRTNENHIDIVGPTCPHKKTHVSNDNSISDNYNRPFLYTECKNNIYKKKNVQQ